MCHGRGGGGAGNRPPSTGRSIQRCGVVLRPSKRAGLRSASLHQAHIKLRLASFATVCWSPSEPGTCWRYAYACIPFLARAPACSLIPLMHSTHSLTCSFDMRTMCNVKFSSLKRGRPLFVCTAKWSHYFGSLGRAGRSSLAWQMAEWAVFCLYNGQ